MGGGRVVDMGRCVFVERERGNGWIMMLQLCGSLNLLEVELCPAMFHSGC